LAQAGKYADESASTDCKLAGEGHYVGHEGATGETQCVAGRYSGSAATTCSACTIGTFSFAGDPSCTACQAGYSSNSTGAPPA